MRLAAPSPLVENVGGRTGAAAMPIERRYQTYFAYLDVPADVRGTLGRRIFRKTLDTDSTSIAKRRAAPLIEHWKKLIEAARGQPNTDDTGFWHRTYRSAKTPEERAALRERIQAASSEADRQRPDAEFWRRALREAKTEADRNTIEEQIQMIAWDIGAANVENIGDNPSSDPTAQRFYAEATGARVPTTEHLDEWIKSLQVKPKTAAMRRATIERLGKKFATVQDVTRPEVRRWLTELLNAEQKPLKPATAKRMMTDCRQFWRYLATIEVVPEDAEPFNKLGMKVGKQASYLPFEPIDAVKLLKAAEQQDRKLGDLVCMAMYTGARREELCALRVEHVRGDRFDIVGAKTQAGIRTVPIHRELKATLARLVEDSTDGYVLSGLDVDRHGSRGDGIGKDFGRLKKELGFGERHAFHSFRATANTMMERAGVPEGTRQDIIGHERSTITGSVYSGKSTFEMRRAALAKLQYPTVVT